MRALNRLYHPITATPFAQDDAYTELVPCEALRPYIRCFWGTTHPMTATADPDAMGLVIPDTCMDVIFSVNYTANRLGGHFCTLDEHSFCTQGKEGSRDLYATFAIRFYAWTAYLFVEEELRGSKNKRYPIDAFFRRLQRDLAPLLFDLPSLEAKARAAEDILLHRLGQRTVHSDLLNAVHYVLSTSGRGTIREACAFTAMSPRRMERLFDAHMGLSPKSFASLIRYQLLWQDMMHSPHFSILDAVDKFGYTDQAHLLHDFKRRHLMSPREAILLARK
ncbi:MAG: AraC family transcriptional regulator [Clostridia bacterium]|nr:AraC family transcriptional regulator [Clostridia bacterium]